MQRTIDPQRNGTYKRPFTHEGNYLVDYCELTKQPPKVQTIQAKSKGGIVLIETAKTDHIWAKLKCAQYFLFSKY